MARITLDTGNVWIRRGRGTPFRGGFVMWSLCDTVVDGP